MISCWFFFDFVKFCLKHSTLRIYDRKNVKFERLINYGITIANVAHLLGPKAYVPAVKSNNFAAGTLQA